MRQEVKDYIEEGNAVEVTRGIYATQDSMYRNRLTEKDLEQYMIDEYGTVFTLNNEESNFWGIEKSSIDKLVEEGELDLGKWYLYYNDAMKEWEATMDGQYTHVFKSLNDLLQRNNEIDFYVYDEELSRTYGEEILTNYKNEKRIY